MRVTCGGKVIYDDTVTLRSKLDEVCKTVNDALESQNRKSRRHKLAKKLMTFFAVVSAMAYTAVAHAEEANPTLATTSVSGGIPDWMMNAFINHIAGSSISHEAPASIYWKLNEIMTQTVFTTQDFFHNPDLVGMFTMVSYTAMSCTSIILAKKGIDMMKASTMGASSMGIGEIMLRCFGSVLITYLTLPIMSYGVKFSNVITQTLISNFAHNLPYSMSATSFIGEIFWILGFFLLFAILMIQYWVRQINLIVLGILAPISTTSWIVDQGQMLGTLIRETVVHLTTPFVQGVIMAIGTAIVTSIAGHQGVDPVNAVFASIATVFVMITVPSFLRKFVTGTVNPFKWAINTAVGVKAMPARLLALAK